MYRNNVGIVEIKLRGDRDNSVFNYERSVSGRRIVNMIAGASPNHINTMHLIVRSLANTSPI